MQLDNAQIYLRKDKASGDADTAVQTGHREFVQGGQCWSREQK